MGNSFVQPHRADPNPTLPTMASHQTSASNHANEALSSPQHSSLVLSPSPSPQPLDPSVTLPSTPQIHLTKPQTFLVPSILRPVLNLSSSSRTPESTTKRALLSNDPSTNSTVLVGMGGAGKTTILCALGRDKDIWAKYSHGIFFFELGHDVKLSHFIRQLQDLVKSAFPDFSEHFNQLAAAEGTHRSMITHLMDRLATKKFLLLFDDVWEVNPTVYKLVCAMCKAVQGNENASLKVLTSTRSRDIADVLTLNDCIAVNPEDCDADKSLRLLCHYARINSSIVSSFSPQNRDAMDHIIATCAGLPLALSVAGSAVKQRMDPNTEHCDQNAFGEYWERLRTTTRQLAGAESGDGHKGLANALETSLQFLEERWESKKIAEELMDHLTAVDMFRSLCIMQKQASFPLSAIEKLWDVTDALSGVRMLSRHSLVTEVREKGKGIVGVRVHDLVLDMSAKMAENRGGVIKWHAKLLDAYQFPTNVRENVRARGSNEEDCWWNLNKSDMYMINNVVRHLLGARRITKALKLLTDYRWVERMNQDKQRPPFQKTIAELQLLQMDLDEYCTTTNARRVVRDVDVVVRAMELAMVPHCMNNRDECTFQLYGRLCDIAGECSVVERLVRSIERHGRRPWARAGRGALTSGGILLKRVLELESDGRCMSVGPRGDEIVVGGWRGKLWVLNGHDGSKKRTLAGHEEDENVEDVYVDRVSRLIYSCNSKGRVIIWKDYKKWHSIQAEGLRDRERINCMLVLLKRQEVVLGTDEGRLLVIDVRSGSTIPSAIGHASNSSSQANDFDEKTKGLNSLTAGRSEDVMVSGSWDGTIRVWDTSSFAGTDIDLEGHEKPVNSVVLSGLGRLLASASDDLTVRLWDMQSGKQIWKSTEHGTYVLCVLFSCDERLLYSVDNDGRICVWRVRNDGHDVSLVHTLRHKTMSYIKSLCLRDASDLLVLNRNGVHVWDAREGDTRHTQVDAFLTDVEYFVVSRNGTTMLTWNRWLGRMETRNVCDVLQRTDRIISTFNLLPPFWPHKLAVSDDRQFFAYSDLSTCVVHVIDALKPELLHTFSDLDLWALSSPSDRKGASLHSAESIERYLESLCFNSDGSIVSAVAVAKSTGEDAFVHKKAFSWHVLSGKPLDDQQLDDGSNSTNATVPPRLNCKQRLTSFSSEDSKNITYERRGKSITLGTLEDAIEWAHYCSTTSRLWVTSSSIGMSHVDLVTDTTQLPLRDEPTLPLLPQPYPSASQETEEVYDVFISHAGTDKFTIAEPLYELLVALGLRVFLDRAELRPGQHASQKMIDAMRTAKIAVVILSPEFAARKWTLKELMCFLERFRAGGERGVIIIPVFYRLTLNDCKDEDSLFDVVNDNGERVFFKERFLQRMVKEDEYGVKDVLRALQALRSVTGIENRNGVTNGTSAEEKVQQMAFIEEIVAAIVEAKKRLERGGAAGPSSSRV